MPRLPELVIGVAAVAVTLGVRAFTANRLIRSKLRLSLVAFVVYVALAALLGYAGLSADVGARLESIANLLFALGGVTLVVVLAINPWRVDHTPEHFPNIVQDAVIIAVFLVVGTSVMQEKFLTTSAVGAVVIGFALQDTLGNLFAGLAIQVEKPFRVGHWIRVGEFEGLVEAITWRATRLRTKTGNAVVVPNNIVSKEAITNYCEPAAPTRLEVEVGVSYDQAPNHVKAVIAGALGDASLVLADPAPQVVLADFAASAITYRIKFWVEDFAADDAARDQVRTSIYYAFRRQNIEIPYPIQVQYHASAQSAGDAADQRARYLAAADLFAPLAEKDRAELAAVSRARIFGAGETIVREGQAGDSMFVVGTGQVRVTIGDNGSELARIGPGGYFGEMSLLTGAPRTATVAAAGDCLVLEIAAEDFRRMALVNPAVVEDISAVVNSRRTTLEKSRQVVAATAVLEEAPRTFLARVRQFLRL